MSRNKNLHSLFYPRSIAVVGASDKGGGAMPIANFHTFRYKGGVYPVNPKYGELGGFRCYPSLLDIPDPVDCAIVRVPAESCPDVLRQCARKGIHAAVIIAGGFGETGAEGIALEKEVKAIADEHGIAVCGPNGMGIINVCEGIPIYMSNALPRVLRPGNVGIMLQSGSILIGFFGADFDLGYSHVISSGNQTVLEPGDYVKFLAEDKNTGVIALYMENIGDVRKFEEGLELAGKNRKPVLALKAGRSARGQLATQAHTGTLAGSYDAFEAFARRYNMVVVDDPEQLIMNCKLFSEVGYRKIPSGVGVATVSGGHKVLAQDIGEEIGLSYANFSAETELALSRVLPSISHIENPVDVTGAGVGNYDIQFGVAEAMAQDPGIGVVLMLQDSCPNLGEGLSVRYSLHAKAMAEVARRHPDRLAIFLNGISNGLSPIIGEPLKDSRVVYMAGMRQSLVALRNYLRWTERVEAERPIPIPVPAKTDGARRKRWLDVLGRYAGQCLPDDLAFELLESYGLPVAPWAFSPERSGLSAEAAKLKYPLVLKMIMDGVAHKSELGLVCLNVGDGAQLESVASDLEEKASRLSYAKRGFLLQKMVKGDCELLLALKREPGFGFTCVCALGGIFVEIFRDSALELLPLASSDMDAMLRRLRGYPILNGARGRAVIDTSPLSGAAENLNALVEELGGRLKALEMNPLIASPVEIRAVDALIEVMPEATPGNMPENMPENGK